MGSCRFEGTGGAGTLILEGDFSIEGAAALKEALAGALDNSSDLAIDVSRLERVDLSFFQLLLSASNTAASRRKTLRVLAPVPEAVQATVVRYGLNASCGTLLGIDGAAGEVAHA